MHAMHATDSVLVSAMVGQSAARGVAAALQFILGDRATIEAAVFCCLSSCNVEYIALSTSHTTTTTTR